VTIEVDTERMQIAQIMGKANTRVKTEYMRRLVSWFNQNRKIKLGDTEIPFGFEIDRNRKIIELATLRSGDKFDGDLHLRVFEDTEEYIVPLPDNFTVLGDLTISAHRRMDYNIGQDQPYDFHSPIGARDWSREGHGPRLKTPDGLKAEGKFTLHGFRTGIDVPAYAYHLVACQVEGLPGTLDRSLSMMECHIPIPLSETLFQKNLLIENCGSVTFGAPIQVKGELTIVYNTKIHHRPMTIMFESGCSVEGNFTSQRTSIEFSSGLTINGSVSFKDGNISLPPERIDVDGDFVTSDVIFDRMPNHLKVGRDAKFEWVKIDRWPTTIEVGGDIKERGVTIIGAETLPQSHSPM
jgi:hypothetical protein